MNLPKAINSISSQEVFRANRSVLPESVEARKMTVISGLTCSGSFKRRDPVGLLARMLLGSSIWHSTKCWLIWKPKITKSNRLLFRLQPSAPRIGEIGFGLSDLMIPTPVASEMVGSEYTKTVNYKDGVFYRRSRGKGERHGARLGQILPRLPEILPTPKAQDSRAGYTDRGKSNFGETIQGSVGLKLQPLFVEWMMGFPPNWTDLNLPRSNTA